MNLLGLLAELAGTNPLAFGIIIFGIAGVVNAIYFLSYLPTASRALGELK